MSDGRVVFVPFISAFGGVERLVIDLCRQLSSRSLPHELACFECTIDVAGIPVRQLGRPAHPLAGGRAIAQLTRDHDRPVLMFDLKSAFYAGLGRAQRYVLHLTDPPSLLPADVSKHAPTLSGRWPGLARAMRAEAVHRINRRGVRKASHLVAMTRRIAAELDRLYGRAAIVVRPGVGAATPPSLEAPRRRLLSVCRLEPSKRVDWILEALVPLPGLELDVVGDGTDRPRLEELARRLKLEGRVKFHGRVSDAALETIFATAEILVMPSVQGYGLPALEALGRGVAVVLHEDSGVSEILGGTPWVEIIEDRAELSRAIAELDRRRAEGRLGAPPDIPSVDDWAAKMIAICEWG